MKHKKERLFIEQPFFRKSILDIGEHVNNTLYKIMYKDKTKLSNIQRDIFLVFQNHKSLLSKQIKDFFKEDFSDINYFLKKLKDFIDIDLKNTFKNNLSKVDNLGNIDIQLKKISLYVLNNDALIELNKINKFDFENDEDLGKQYENIDFISDIKDIENNRRYILNKKVFYDLFNKISINLINDLKIILGIIKNGDYNFTEGVHSFYELDSVYKYMNNIYLFVYMINKVLYKHLLEFNNTLHIMCSMANSNLMPEEINLISYNSMKKNLLK